MRSTDLTFGRVGVPEALGYGACFNRSWTDLACAIYLDRCSIL